MGPSFRCEVFSQNNMQFDTLKKALEQQGLSLKILNMAASNNWGDYVERTEDAHIDEYLNVDVSDITTALEMYNYVAFDCRVDEKRRCGVMVQKIHDTLYQTTFSVDMDEDSPFYAGDVTDENVFVFQTAIDVLLADEKAHVLCIIMGEELVALYQDTIEQTVETTNYKQVVVLPKEITVQLHDHTVFAKGDYTVYISKYSPLSKPIY